MNKENEQQPQDKSAEMAYEAENATTDVGMDTFFAANASADANPVPVKGMSKNSKALLVGGCALLLLGGVLAGVMIANKKAEDDTPIDTEALAEALMDDEETGILINDNAVEDIQKVYVSNTDDFTVYLKTAATDEESAVYAIEGLEDVVLDNSLVSTLANNASTLSANSLVEEAPEDVSKYGLSEPVAEVTMSYQDGATFTFSIGSVSPMDSTETYCEVNGDVYLVKSSLLANYQKVSTDFISKVILEEPDDEDYPIVESLRVERKDLDYDIYLEYDYENADDDSVGGTAATHIMLEPVHVYLNVEKSSDVTNGMFGITGVEIAKVHPTTKDLQEAGLDDPFCTVTMVCDDGNTYQLYFGDTYTTSSDTTAYYTYMEGGNLIYGVSESRAVWTSVLPDDINSANIFGTMVWDIGTLDVSGGGYDYHFVGEGTDADDYVVTKNGETCDTERFRLLYKFFLNIYGEELYLDAEIPGEPDAEVHLTTQDGKEDYTVSFYKLTDITALITLDGVPTYKIRTSCIDTIWHNLEIFDNLDEDFTMTWQ